MDNLLSYGIERYKKSISNVNRRFNESVRQVSKDSNMTSVGQMLQTTRLSIYKYMNYVLPKFMQLHFTVDSNVLNKLSELRREYAKTNQINKVSDNLIKLSAIFGILYVMSSGQAKKIFEKKIKSSIKTFLNLVKDSLVNISDLDMDKFHKTFLDKGNTLLKNIIDMLLAKGADDIIDKGVLVSMYIISALMMTELFLLVKITVLKVADKI